MKKLDCVLIFLIALVVAMPLRAATVLYYDFDDGTPNAPMNDYPVTQTNGTVGTHDLSGNGYDMHAWDDYWGPLFSAEGDTPTGQGLSSVHDGHRDGYTLDDGIRLWSPSTWTIELSFRLNDPNGWRTLIGRDDWTGITGDVAASMYIQSNGENNAMRVVFATVSDERYWVDSSLIPEPGHWYHFAVAVDGDQLTMYADYFDGNGPRKAGSLMMTPGLDHSLRPTGNWTFGRGWFNGNFTDHVDGNIDNVRFSDVALTPDELIPAGFLSNRIKAHDPQPANGATKVPVNQVFSWTTGVDPCNPDQPNPAIVGHNLWLSAPYEAANPPASPDWGNPAVQVIQIPADTNPADGVVDPTASHSLPLEMDKVYFWIVDENIGASSTTDWDNLITGQLWTFQTLTSAPVVDAGDSILTWLKDGSTTVDLAGSVTDATGDVTSIQWSIVESPEGSTVDIADTTTPTTTATLDMTGHYVLQLYAIDAAVPPHEETDQMEINVYSNACEAAKNNPKGYTASPFDFDGNCKVDFADFALMAGDWLEDTALTEDTLY